MTLGLQGDSPPIDFIVSGSERRRIGVMIVIIVVGYVALRIFSIVFAEYKRLNEAAYLFTIDLLQNLARYLVYGIVAVLLLTNVLVMAGLQTLAGTMVTLFTVFIGLVVSFAATALSGTLSQASSS